VQDRIWFSLFLGYRNLDCVRQRRLPQQPRGLETAHYTDHHAANMRWSVQFGSVFMKLRGLVKPLSGCGFP
jgi:hypothetical protein